MPITELEELQQREQLDSGGLSELQELNVREAIESGEAPRTTPAPAPEQPQEQGFIETIGREVLGALETGTAFVSGAGAEAAGGIAGLAKTITTGPEAGQEVIEKFREGLTFQPRTEEGKRNLETAGKIFTTPIPIIDESVASGLQKTEKFLGDFGADILRKTGSPTLEAFGGAFGSTLPTAALELLGLKGAGKLAKRQVAKKGAKRTKEQVKALQEAAPSVDQLKAVARGVYKEIDELGATIKPKQYGRLVDDIQSEMKKGGFRPRIDDKVAQLLDEFNIKRDGVMTVLDIDDLRTVAKGFADNIDPKTKALGNRIIDSIDSFLDSSDVLDVPKGAPANVGQRYKVARKFWGQARKSETIADMVELAEANRGGFVNGIRTEFLKLVRNKKRNKFFSKEERLLIKQVADGDKTTNLFKNLAKLNITRAGGGSLIPLAGPAAGIGKLIVGGGDVAAGGGLTLLGPFAGAFSEALAIKLTKGNARFADDILRAGKDGKKIAKSYFENVPKGKRSTAELADLLLDPELDVSKLPKTKFTEEALRIAERKRTELLQGVVLGGIAEIPKAEQELP